MELENGISEIRVFEADLLKDRHYIMYGTRGGKNHLEIGRITFKYNYVTIKMQLEIDKLKAQIEVLKNREKTPKTAVNS